MHAQAADVSFEYVHLFDPTTHWATWQLGATHDVDNSAAESGVYTHPVVALQLSTVQMSPSLHTVVVTSQLPVTLLQVYCVQRSLGGHVFACVVVHALLLHPNVQHALLVPQSDAMTDAFLGVRPHPVAG